MPMYIWYTVYDVEITYPYPGFIQEFLQDLILGLQYSGLFSYNGLFLYHG